MLRRFTLNAIRGKFSHSDYSIYRLDADTPSEMIVVVNFDGNVLVTFEPIDGVYQVYDDCYYNVKFSEVAHLWADTITKLA